MVCRRDSSDDTWTILMYTSYAQYHINNAQLCVNLGVPRTGEYFWKNQW